MLRGPAPTARQSAPSYRNAYRGGFGGWGGGYWGGGYWNSQQPAMVVEKPAEPKPPVLTSSSLYEADRAKPVMREYGSLPSPAKSVATAVTVVAFRNGQVEPVLAYWLEGDKFAFVTTSDTVRKVLSSTVDAARSESLNRQQGVDFKLR